MFKSAASAVGCPGGEEGPKIANIWGGWIGNSERPRISETSRKECVGG